ncbi:MAG: transglycosylase domain-containing protein [Saprospiraceae bacterium]
MHIKWRAFRQKSPKWAFALKWGFGLGIVGLLSVGLLILSIYWGFLGPLPNYAELKNIQNNTASEIYGDQGILLGKFYIENRINADFEEISPNVINALVATEDARFFEHSGIDIRAWMRVLFKSVLLFDESSGGGSTISQQLAKNLYPRISYSLFSTPINKIREMFVARRLENIYTKEDLLRLYLNTVPFSENIFGIKVAAQRFFKKSPDQLGVEEAAVLVGMLKGTTLYNPIRNPELATQRRNTVMNQMVKYNYLDQNACDSLKEMPLELQYFREGNNAGLATYFREQVRLEVNKILEDYPKPDGSAYNIFTDGLKIYTSIDPRLQQYAEAAVNTHMPELQQAFYKNWEKRGDPWGGKDVLDQAKKNSRRYQQLKAKGLNEEAIDQVFDTPISMQIFSWEDGDVVKEMSPLDSLKYYLSILNTGFLAIEPNTGLVRAWVGGINHKYFQYDHVKSRRQVGSIFKPIVYAQALRNGMLPCEYTDNKQVVYADYKDWQPRNADGNYEGVYSMEGALSHSVNTVTVEIMRRGGLDSTRLLATDMGIEGEIPDGPAIALGAVDASLQEMISVYATFANRGIRPTLHYLDRIETSDGNIIAEFTRPDPKTFTRVLSEEIADMMTKMMESVIDSGTAKKIHYRYGIYGAIAGKTGTTQNHSDGWFMGFTPKLVAGVWVGAESPRVHFRTMGVGQGSNTALPIWGEFMKSVYKDPTYKHYRRTQFEPLSDSLSAMMQCPPYLDEMPTLLNENESWEANYYDQMYLFQALQDIPPENIRYLINQRPRRNFETISDYADRLRKLNVRLEKQLERQENRKDFWDKLLFRKKGE